jgi:iron complex outermembrane receptor protein
MAPAASAPTAPSASSPAAPAAPEPTAPAQRIVVEGRGPDEAEQRRNATLGMLVVGREELDQHGDTSVLDVLQRLPGITLDGDMPRLRGLGGGYTLILLNGEPAPPGFSLDQLAPGDIERIEVIKGPTAENGGVAGSINVILRSAPKLRTRELRSALGYRALAPQTNHTLSWGDRIGALGFQLPLTAYTSANAGEGVVQRVSRPAGSTRREDRVSSQDEWRGGGVNFTPRLDWKLSEADALSAQLFLQRNESRNLTRRSTEVLEGTPATYASESSATRGTWEMQRLQGQWVHKQADGSRLEIKGSAQGSLSRSWGAWEGRLAQGTGTALRDNLNSQRERRYSQSGRWRQPIGDTHTLLAGWEVEHRHRRELRRLFEDFGSGAQERIRGSLGSPFVVEVERQVLYAQDEWQPGVHWSVVAGVRGERNRSTVQGLGEEVQASHGALLPLVHVRRAFDTQGRRVLRASASQSLRAPDAALLLTRYSLNGNYERDLPNTPLAADSAGNPALQPEKATAFELAFETQLPAGGVFSVGVFHRQIDGLIRRRIALETVPEAPVPRWVSRPSNIGQARSTGLEVELKGRARELLSGWPGPASALQLRASVSLYRSAVEQIDDPNARLEGQPPWQATLGFDNRVARSGFSYGANFTMTPSFSTAQTDRQRIWRGADRRLDAFIAWRVDAQLQLRLAGNNLLPMDAVSRSSVADLDGFTAGSSSRRSTVTQLTAHAVLRF